MRIDDLKYVLNSNNLTAEPREVRLGRRDLGRMLIVDRKSQKQIDSFVLNLPDHFNEGDVLVLNDSKRVPGILKGVIKSNNAQVELQFIGLGNGKSALCRIYPVHYIQIGVEIKIGNDLLIVSAKPEHKNNLFEVTAVNKELAKVLKDHGFPINAFFSSTIWNVDYLNTFYSKKEGSVESPLAGLHFTPELLDKLTEKGVKIEYVTLHSVGSWLPFMEDHIDDHKVFEEQFEISEETAVNINEAKKQNKVITVCGSTAMRTLESATDASGNVVAQRGGTSLYIKPGYKFKMVDRYFTNFHQYKTSLMVLDASFCGYELLMKSIDVAKERGYLFYEFGDAVFYI